MKQARGLDNSQVLFSHFSGGKNDEVKCKNEQGKHSSILTEQAWLIEDLLYHQNKIFSQGTNWAVPREQDYGSVLPKF